MRKHTRSLLTSLTATLLLALATTTATAGHLSVSNRNFRLVWRELSFFGSGTGSTESTIVCPVTLEGSFHSATVAKVLGALIGQLTRATFAGASCTGGRFTVLQASLPWHVTYEGFSGTLPRISRVRLLLRTFAFALEVSGGLGTACLYRETETSAAGEAIVEARGAITGLEADESIRLPLIRSEGIGGFLCPSEIGFRGTGSMTLLGNTSLITIRLI